MVDHHDIPHSLPAPDVEPRFGRRRKWIEALIAAAKCLFVIFVKTVVVFLAETMWKAYFDVRVLQKHVIASIFSELQRIFFILQFLHQEKKRQDTSLKFHTIGVWEFDVKGFVNMTKVSDMEWSVTISRDLMFHGFQGFWREHLADLCGTVRLRSADDVAQSRSLRRGVAFPWGTGGLVICSAPNRGPEFGTSIGSTASVWCGLSCLMWSILGCTSDTT